MLLSFCFVVANYIDGSEFLQLTLDEIKGNVSIGNSKDLSVNSDCAERTGIIVDHRVYFVTQQHPITLYSLTFHSYLVEANPLCPTP